MEQRTAVNNALVVTLPVVISFVALCISCIALWKGHFVRFSPLALAGKLHHRVYPIRNAEERWYITSFDIPVSITNPGARPGLVTGLRLRLHYPGLPFAGNHEFIPPLWELRPDKANCIDKDRFNWLKEVVACDWSPFVILPKATVTKHLLFEARWGKPVVQKWVIATLELQTDWRAKWLTVTKWQFPLPANVWVDLENGTAFGCAPERGHVALDEPETFPPDLHKYTGTKAPLPKDGMVTAAEPSYLDYPESKND